MQSRKKVKIKLFFDSIIKQQALIRHIKYEYRGLMWLQRVHNFRMTNALIFCNLMQVQLSLSVTPCITEYSCHAAPQSTRKGIVYRLVEVVVLCFLTIVINPVIIVSIIVVPLILIILVSSNYSM